MEFEAQDVVDLLKAQRNSLFDELTLALAYILKLERAVASAKPSEEPKTE